MVPEVAKISKNVQKWASNGSKMTQKCQNCPNFCIKTLMDTNLYPKMYIEIVKAKIVEFVKSRLKWTKKGSNCQITFDVLQTDMDYKS